MTRALRRRLDRLTDRIAVGRLITVSVAHECVDDADMIDATFAAEGIERSDADLVVLITRFGTLGAEPQCTLLSVTPLNRKALQ